MKRLKSNLLLISVVLLLGCSDRGAKELREFAQIEAAIGMVAGASTFERGIRLEQLEKIEITSEDVRALRNMCASAYKSFNRAAGLLQSARQRTESVEAQVTALKKKKASGVSLTTEEETQILSMSQAASESLKSVTHELDIAEEMVAACQAKRAALRRKFNNR